MNLRAEHPESDEHQAAIDDCPRSVCLTVAGLPTGISRSRDIQGKEAKFLGSIFARWDGAVEIYHLNSDEFDSDFADVARFII